VPDRDHQFVVSANTIAWLGLRILDRALILFGIRNTLALLGVHCVRLDVGRRFGILVRGYQTRHHADTTGEKSANYDAAKIKHELTPFLCWLLRGDFTQLSNSWAILRPC